MEETFRLQLQTVFIGSRLSSATFSGCYLLFLVVLIIFAKLLGFLALLALIVTFLLFLSIVCLSFSLSVSPSMGVGQNNSG